MNDTTQEPGDGKSHRLRRLARIKPVAAEKGDKGDKGDEDVDVFTAFLDALHDQS